MAGLSAACTAALLFPMTTAVADPLEGEDTGEEQVSYYSFDEESGADSWGSRDGVTTDLDFAEGVQGSALRVVDGEGMKFEDPIGIGENDAWSVSYWVRVDEAPTGHVSVLMDAEKDYATSLKMAPDRHSGFRVGKGDGDVLTFAYNQPTGFEADTWYHVAWAQSKDLGLTNYVNGQQVNVTNAWTKTNRILIPMDIVGGTGFTGEIDELKVYGHVLGLDDVNADLVSTAPEGWLDPMEPALPITNTIPEYQLPAENLSDVEKAPGTDRQYLGQPDLIQTETGKLISAFPIGHGKGPLIMKVSEDNGETWTEKTDLPSSWTGSQETPTMFVLDMPDGSERLLLVTGNPGWGTDNAGYSTGWNTSYSDDDGETWNEYTHWHENHEDGSENNVIVAMSSLVQLKDDNGEFISKWMGVYHDYDFVNYKTYLTIDENGNEQWSTPEPYLSDFRDTEALYQICELGMFRSPDGDRIIGLARSQSHNNPATLIYSDDEGETWSEPMDLPGSLAGERHKPTYDPVSDRIVIPFREIVYDLNGNGQFDGFDDWRAGNWVAWVGTYDQLMTQEEGEYRILLGEDWSNNLKGGDTGYTGVVTQPDGTFIMHTYGHWDKEFSQSWTGGITTDLSWIKQAKFNLCDFEAGHGLDPRFDCVEQTPVERIPGEFVSQRIALGGDGVFPNYRIPAVIQLNNGDILVSYDGRPTGADSPGPNSILQRRSTDGGRSWGETTVVSQGKTAAPIEGYSDPSYVYDAETNTLFNFHVYSKDTGFWNSINGTDDDNRQVMSTWVAVSEDNGHTWEHRSVTAVAKPEHVAGTFASSGHGIQITRGEYAGRLVQQYAGRFPNGEIKAYSLYSDDHGDTWQMGEPVGTIMDENKVVELSDGTLMMNSRVNHTHNARWVAYSTDGGETWSEPEMDHTLVDPRNNASIIQMNPGAEAGSPEAKELLFSNSANTVRSNGTVSYTCDDGQTWPVMKTYEPGAHSYSDLVALDDGTFGVLFEGLHSEQLYGSFDREWLMPFCADFEGATLEIDAGETAGLEVTFTNNDSVTLPAGTATVTAQAGWESGVVDVPALAPGESADLTIPVTAPAHAAADSVVHGEISIEAGDYSVRGDAVINLGEGLELALDAQIVGYPGDSDRDVVTDPYSEGDRLSYHFRVDSLSNVPQTVAPISGDFYPFVPEDGSGNCRWRSLAPGTGYTCTTTFHTVTADELADGFFLPKSAWSLTDQSSTGLEEVIITVIGDPVSLRERTPGLEVTLSNAEVSDEDGDGFAQAGDVITYDATVTNSGNVRLTDIGGITAADELAVDESVTVQLSYVITDADIEAEAAQISAAEATGHNGELTTDAQSDALTVELAVEEESTDPEEPTDPVDPEPTDPVSGNVFFIVNDWNSTTADLEIEFGQPGDEVFVGDWDGDGIDTLAIRNDTTFSVYNDLDGDADLTFKYGRIGDDVLVGDWDGNGTDTLAVRRGNTYYINNALTGGNADTEFKYGRAGDDVLVGDWDGDSTDTLAVRRGNTYYINNALTGGNADIEFNYGRVADEAFAGDFNGSGSDTISLRRGNTFYINNALVGGTAEQSIGYGRADDVLLIGDWDGDGTDTPALNRVL